MSEALGSDQGLPAQEQFILLRDQIFKNTGLDLSRYKENYLKRRIAARMRALGAETYSAYASLLGSDPGEYDRLVDRVTVNVTEFFRDADVYAELAELIAKRPASLGRTFAVWSAGCSSGEEPYSLVMLMERLRREGGQDLEYSVLATDIDDACLQRAKRGSYPLAAAAKLDAWYRDNCLAMEGEEVLVKPQLKRRIYFEKHNLFSDPPPTGLDLVLCRNVMIYFSRPLQQRLLDAFHKALLPGGMFILGKTETILGPARQYYSCLSAKTRIFERLRTMDV